MGFGQRIGQTFRVPGHGLRRSLIVMSVLVVAAGSGVVISLTAPALAGNLGLVASQPVVAPPGPDLVLVPLQADAPVPTSVGLDSMLDPLTTADALGRFTGVVLDPAASTVSTALWERSPDRALVPGSTGKLLTAAAALLTLDSTDRLTTRVAPGPEPGTVVLVGGGDPTLTALPAGTDSVYPQPARLSELAAEVRAATAGPIKRVLIDTSRYEGRTLAPGWDPADVADGFVAPIEPLMLDGGRVDPTLQDGSRITDPALAAGRALAEMLGTDPDKVAEGTAIPDAKSLGIVSSATVGELVEHVMRSSDNVLAEALAREVARVRDGETSFTGAAAQTVAALTQAGFDTTGVVLVDGSGLSNQDRVPARLLGAVLAAAAAPALGERDTQFLRPIITGLPVAGGEGTLDERFAVDTASAAGRGAVRAKTGTLTGVSSLAGVTIDADGRLLVFALMSNGASPTVVRPRMDAMVAALSRCGCR
ncbi:MAG: D-alanyl-D-alanine carboxypeptidase/D-alanyl-D-alanine endopeptidase [Pseudonocardia sp.]